MQVLARNEFGYIIPGIIPDHFVQVWNNQHRVIDKFGNILRSTNVDFNFFTGLKDAQNNTLVFNPTMYTAQQTNGKTFVLNVEWLCEVTPRTVRKVALIPQFDASSIHGRIFAHDGRIRVSNGKKVFFLNDQDLLEEDPFYQGQFFYRWANLTMKHYEKNTKLLSLRTGAEKQFQPIEADQTFFSFCGGGVAVFHNQQMQNFTVLSLVTKQKAVVQGVKLDQKNIKEILELDACGLTLPKQLLIQLFGVEFAVKRDNHFQKFQQTQINCSGYYLQESLAVHQEIKLKQLEDSLFQRIMNAIQRGGVQTNVNQIANEVQKEVVQTQQQNQQVEIEASTKQFIVSEIAVLKENENGQMEVTIDKYEQK